MVLDYEYKAIVQACNSIDPRWTPKIDLIVCGKVRWHAHEDRLLARSLLAFELVC